MDSADRMRIALERGCPDKVPLYWVHDERYVIKAQNKTVRDYITGTAEEMSGILENGFYLHPCDGCLVEGMYRYDFRDHNTLEDIQKDSRGDYHIFCNTDTGERYKMDEGGNRYSIDGRPCQDMPSSFESLITCRDDISRLVPKNQPPNFDGEFGLFCAARRLAARNPGHHFSLELTTPLVRAVQRCGGYEAGLCLLQDEPNLMMALMEAEMELEMRKMPAIVEAGAKSVYLTSFFTGSDTIAPDIFRRMVLPLETEMIKQIHSLGLFVIYWFLGNMEPLLQDFRTIPFDALAPEQPRKGYGVSYKTLREVLGHVCLMAHTREEDMIYNKQDSMRSYFDTQYQEAGQDGAFIAGVTITPENANPEALRNYASIVEEYTYQKS